VSAGTRLDVDEHASSPTYETCGSEPVSWESRAATSVAGAAFCEPSVATRILVGKMLIAMTP
jgi:hypothetical protein